MVWKFLFEFFHYLKGQLHYLVELISRKKENFCQLTTSLLSGATQTKSQPFLYMTVQYYKT